MEYGGNMYMNHSEPVGIMGLKRAVVMDLNDPQKLNRVKLKFVDENIESVYAPVISSTAGNKVKTVFIPSKDDEVLVGFLDGKISEPVIIGSLYNSKNKAPLSINSARNETMVTELSTDIRITTTVSKNNSSIEIKNKKGNTITLKSGAEQRLLVKSGDNIEFDLDFIKGICTIRVLNEINLSVGKGMSKICINKDSIDIKSQRIGIDSASNVNIKANAATKIEGAVVGINGSTKVDVKAGGPTSISGALVNIN